MNKFDNEEAEEEENALNMDALSKMNIANTKVKEKKKSHFFFEKIKK